MSGNGTAWEPVGSSRELHLAKAGRARKARLRRRRLLLLAAVPFVLVGLVLGFKLAFLPVIASSAATAYAEGDYRRATDAFEGQQTLNIVEPWKAHFNTGTSLLREERFYAATRALHEAYETAESEDAEVRCTIKTNLSLAYELEGDDMMGYGRLVLDEVTEVLAAEAARDAGLPYDEDLLDASGGNAEARRDEAHEYFEYAERSYGTADQVRRWPDCEDLSEEQDETDEQARQRLEDKSQEAQDARSDDEPEDSDGNEDGEDEEPDDGDDPEDDSDGDEGDEQTPDGGQTEEERQAEQERQERLEQQNTEARQEQDQLEQMYGDLYGGQGGSGTDTGDDGGGGTKRW